MPRRPLMISWVAASCGSFPSRNRPAMASKAGSSVMVTDSVAFCANPVNSGIASLGFGAAQARAGASSTRNMGKLRFFMKRILDFNLDARLFIAQRCRLILNRFVRKIQFLTGQAQRFDHLATRLQATLLQSLLLQVPLDSHRQYQTRRETCRQPPHQWPRAF